MLLPIRIAGLIALCLVTSSARLHGPGRTGERGDPISLEQLIVRSRDGNKWVRKRAIERLAALDDPRAWPVVVAALGDRSGEVADAAQWGLAELGPGEVRASLLGRQGLRSRDPWVRCRAAEVLGRMQGGSACGDQEVEALAGLLRDRDAETRRMAAFALERIAREGGEGVSERISEALGGRLGKEREPEIRARMLAAAGVRATGRGAKAVLDALDDREPSPRAAAAGALPSFLEPARSVPHLADLLGDEAVAVRLHAADALRRTPTRDAALALAARLAVESEPRVLDAIVAVLRAYSGLRHRRDPRPWRDWAESLPEDWEVPPVPAVEPEPRKDASVAGFLGLPIESAHVSFLIDLSGSMWTRGADGRTRKDRVRDALEAALGSLPKETRFNLIPYTERPHPLWKSLKRASGGNVREALRFFDHAGDQGTGNVWDAVLVALEDPEVDTLILLTDGAPTGGRHNRMELLVPLLLERVEFRSIVLHSILVDSPRRLKASWDELARATGGRSIAVELLTE
ncbi:MAG TPA: VWA domain-containing protein [Planctomycetes bacterium]|nr:VWA domain-containing protein [Planctomycetota bacterium]